MKNQFNKYVSIVIVSLLTIPSFHLQAQPSVQDLSKYMNALRNSPYSALPKTILTDIKNDDKLLKVLVPFYTDTLKVIRQKAYYITKIIGQRSVDAKVQQRAITYTLLALGEKDTGISGNAIEALSGFNRDNFSEEAKDSIGNLVKQQTPHLEELLKLVGFLELKDQIPNIQSVLLSNASVNVKWAARLALARMRDENAVRWIVNKLKSAQVNDDFVYDVVPDLIYTRHPEIFDFLETIINNDVAGCQSSNPDSDKKILCGYRVIEQVAPVIKDFPLKVDESGDLIVSDYKMALKQVRSWLTTNDNYTILTDTY